MRKRQSASFSLLNAAKVGVRCLLLLAGLLVAAPESYATPITFTVQGTASGTVGGVSFSNEAFTITQTSDTSLVSSYSGYTVDYSTPYASGATMSITGFGSGTISTQTQIFDNQAPTSPSASIAGITCITCTGGDIYARDIAFATYSLQAAPFGPITTTDAAASRFVDLTTTLGTVSFTSTSGAVTFAANAPVAAVPEPESYAMLLPGLALIGFMAGRRKRKEIA